MQNTPYIRQIAARQTGSTLIIALLVLVVILLTGLAAMNNSSSQFKMAANAQFESAALNKAETALATAEDWLSNNQNHKNAGFTNYQNTTKYLYPIGQAVDDFLTMTWDDNNSISLNNDSTQRYLIELLAQNMILHGADLGDDGRPSTGCSKVNIYRITTRGQSARGATKLVQSIYSALNC
jgi:Tfp pilus assembly protein PilX